MLIVVSLHRPYKCSPPNPTVHVPPDLSNTDLPCILITAYDAGELCENEGNTVRGAMTLKQ